MNTKLELWSSVRFRKAWVQELVDFQKHIWFRWTFRCVTSGLRRKSAVDWLTATFTRMRHWLIGCCLDLSLMRLLTFKCTGYHSFAHFPKWDCWSVADLRACEQIWSCCYLMVVTCHDLELWSKQSFSFFPMRREKFSALTLHFPLVITSGETIRDHSDLY